MADDPARERAVADATPGEYFGDLLSVGATEQVVDAEVEGGGPSATRPASLR